ncbi:MAG: BrnT family toxin [Lysobacterales bacterium]
MKLDFEWDAEKAAANLSKHGVSFTESAAVFFDPDRIERYDGREDYGEDRYVTVGRTDAGELTIAYTLRGDVIRIFSARKATRHEQRQYWKDR